MKLLTEIEEYRSDYKISHRDKGLLLGSCFASNMAEKMTSLLFNIDVNPFGIIYNPSSIVKTLLMAEKNEKTDPKDIILHKEIYCNLDFHSSFADTDKENALKKMDEATDKAHSALKKCQYIIITLGTSIVHHYKPTNNIVSNCNKLPSNLFENKKLTVEDTVEMFSMLFDREPYNKKQIIFTLSPIRHTKSGLIENSLSKAILRVAIDILKNKYSFVHYFHSYEIMIDELRDYRFYNEDMLHPSAVAISHIWDKFGDAFFSKETFNIISEVDKLSASLSHRPFNSHSLQHKKFLDNLSDRISDLNEKYPYIDFSVMLSAIKNQHR